MIDRVGVDRSIRLNGSAGFDRVGVVRSIGLKWIGGRSNSAGSAESIQESHEPGDPAYQYTKGPRPIQSRALCSLAFLRLVANSLINQIPSSGSDTRSDNTGDDGVLFGEVGHTVESVAGHIESYSGELGYVLRHSGLAQ